MRRRDANSGMKPGGSANRDRRDKKNDCQFSAHVVVSISGIEFHLAVPERFATGALIEKLVGGATVDWNVAGSESASAVRATESAQFTNENDKSKRQ
jgi:hypothetical protein